MSDLIEKLEREGAGAMEKHYSLGMWKLCADAAQALRAAAEREKDWVSGFSCGNVHCPL